MIYLIDNVAFGGEGVARSDGLAVFIPFTLPKEKVLAQIVKKKSNFARANLLKILEESPDRIEPLCSYFSTCGGCQLQHASYSKQLEIKKKFVEDSLLRIGKISFPIPDVIASSLPFAYRRHISLKLERFQESWQLSFTSVDAKPLAIQHCFLFHEVTDPILHQIQSIIKKIPSSFDLDARMKIFKSSEKYILALICQHELPLKVKNTIQSLTSLPLVQGVTLQTPSETTQWGDCYLSFSCLNLTFTYSPFSFVQNHAEQSERIVSLILELAKDSQKILDLYCGIGVSALALAQKGKSVHAIELNQTAVLLAEENAKKNELSEVLFFCSPAENCLEKVQSFEPDTILVNPPKTGLDPKVLQAFEHLSVQQIIYVSCHPPTLARDCALLQTMGYNLVFIQSFDMFPQTTHVETVVKFTRK